MQTLTRRALFDLIWARPLTKIAAFVLVNDVLQGNMGRAWTTTQRFVVNTTVGAAGLFDVASDGDLPAHKADFGQTLSVWGVESGPSVQLPLLGPSNLRDAAGTAVGLLCDPVGYVPGCRLSRRHGRGGRRHRWARPNAGHDR